MVRANTFALFCLFIIALAAIHPVVRASPFEDVEIRAIDNDAWYNRNLEPRAASNPGSTSTTSTTAPSPTNSGGFPTGDKPGGSQCTKSDQCQTGNCQGGKCKQTSPPGSYGCKKPQNCDSGNCYNGKCVPKPGQGAIDSPCNGSYQCKSGTFCQNSSCQSQGGNGASCYKPVGCSSGHCTNGKCATAGTTPNGQGCKSSSQCQANSFCNRGKCATLGGHGARCYKAGGCASNVCRRRHCV